MTSPLSICEHERDELAAQLRVLDKEVRDLRAWQRAIGEGTGYINTCEGQDGYEVADPEDIIGAWREMSREHASYEEMSATIAGLDCDDGCGCGQRHCSTEESVCMACLLTSHGREAEAERDAERAAHLATRQELSQALADAAELRAEVERRDALIRSDGYDDMRAHAQGLAQQVARLTRERDEAREQRNTAQVRGGFFSR